MNQNSRAIAVMQVQDCPECCICQHEAIACVVAEGGDVLADNNCNANGHVACVLACTARYGSCCCCLRRCCCCCCCSCWLTQLAVQQVAVLSLGTGCTVEPAVVSPNQAGLITWGSRVDVVSLLMNGSLEINTSLLAANLQAVCFCAVHAHATG